MNGEVQLIVTQSNNTPIYAALNGVAFGTPGTTKIGVNNYNESTALVGQTIILINSSAQQQTVTVTSVQVDVPNLGFTTINFGSALSYDFRQTAGGFFNQIIDSQYYVDLFENESISQNWKFQDLSNFTSQGAFSREFRVPFSQSNQQALGALFDVNVTAGTENYFHYKLPAEIRVDTLPIATGYVRVRKVYKQQNRINEVELAFYAETPDLVRNIGEKKLSDIAALSTLDETVNYNNVTNPSDERIWTILDRGQLWSEGGEQGTRSLITATSPVYAGDLTPALSWWWLFENIISEAGFELAAGTLENILETYWMPWLNSQNPSTNTNQYFFQAYNSATSAVVSVIQPLPLDIEVFDTNNVFNNTTYTFTAPLSGSYTFSGQIRLENATVIDGEVFLFNKINGGPEVLFAEILIPEAIVVNEQYNYSFTTTVFLNQNDTYQLMYAKSVVGSSAIDLIAGTGNFQSTILQLNQIVPNFSHTLNYNLNAPDMKQIDFVTDVIKMHNCAIVPDRAITNKIYIVPQNSYLGSGDTLDWTPKLDTSKDIVLSSTTDLQKAKFQFTYTAGEELIAQPYRNVNRIYGDYEAVGYTVNPNTAPSDFAIGDQKIQLVTRSTPSGVVNGSGYVMPMFFNDSLKFVTPGPRCLFEAGAHDIQLYDDGISTPVLTSVPVLNNYSVIYAEIDDEDLNWAPEFPPHFINSNPYNNLFNKYWRSYMNALYSPEGRMLEASFALDLKDILTFKFSDKVWIQDSYYRILEITDYKVGNYESTKVKLLKIVEETEDCSGTPASVSVNGEVNFEDANGDPIVATQDCCIRYGYNWDEDNGICWAFTLNGTRPQSPTSGPITNPSPRVIKATSRNAAIVNSTVNGTNVEIEFGNVNMLAVGENLDLTADVRGSNLLGKNVVTNLPGIHVGGGYRDGDPTSIYYGWAQFGQFVLQSKPTIPSSGTVIDLDIEGVAGEYINMTDDTLWSVLMNVTIKDATGASETSLHHFTLDKLGGLANASAITTLNTIGAIGANVFTFGIDTTTNTNEHRINVTFTGGTYPDQFVITASIQYQQSKTQ